MLSVVVGLVHKKKLCTAVGATTCLIARLIFTDNHRAEFLQSLKIGLELLKMIADNLCVITVVNHINVSEVLAWIALVLAIDLNDLVDGIASAI